MTSPRLRLALDQNFPTPLLTAVRDYLPADIGLSHLYGIDPRLSDLSDRTLFIALRQLGYDGLVTNNYKMLDVPEEVPPTGSHSSDITCDPRLTSTPALYLEDRVLTGTALGRDTLPNAQWNPWLPHGTYDPSHQGTAALFGKRFKVRGWVKPVKESQTR